MENDSVDPTDTVQENLWRLSSAVRDACFEVAAAAYEDARMDGLCHEGAWECALEAMHKVKFESVLTAVLNQTAGIK